MVFDKLLRSGRVRKPIRVSESNAKFDRRPAFVVGGFVKVFTRNPFSTYDCKAMKTQYQAAGEEEWTGG